MSINSKIIACLPFVELSHNTCIEMGGVLFWRASEYRKYIRRNLYRAFLKYLDWIGEYKISVQGKQITATKLLPNQITCISVDKGLASKIGKNINILLGDAVYLFYFISHFHKFRAERPESINAFLKIRNAEEEFVKNNSQWTNQFNFEHQRENTVRIRKTDGRLFTAAGKLLEIKCLSINPRKAERIIRAIRYFSNRFFDKYREPIKYFASEPEDIVFISTAFESLFDLHEISEDKWHTQEKFKKKLTELLSLENDIPNEILNKWLEGFYNLRSKVVHGEKSPDTVFKGNPNFEVPYISLGIKIFLVSVYYELSGCGLISSTSVDSWLKKDFEIFFWPQKALLETIRNILARLKNHREFPELPINFFELEKLEDLYIEIFGDLPLRDGLGFKFIPSDKNSVDKLIKQIKTLFEQEVTIGSETKKIKEFWAGKVNNQSATDRFLSLLNQNQKDQI